MSIKILFFNIVIPISNFSKCKDIKNLAGAIKFYEKQNKGKSIWYDDHLFTLGGIMNQDDVENEIKQLEEAGLNLYKLNSNEQEYDDLCAVSMIDGLPLQCSWLDCHTDPYSVSYVWLKGHEEGSIIHPKI
ncbi:MAG: hypothetical protein WCK37_04950 [Candidatus Falkowbacteria bacterium]